jgi:hypothetical protein
VVDRRLLAGLFWTRREVAQAQTARLEDLALKVLRIVYPPKV